MSTAGNNSNGPQNPDDVTDEHRPGVAERTGARLTSELTAELDAAVEAIDSSIVRRLNDARREALAQVSGKRYTSFFGTSWASAAIGVTALLVVVLLWFEPLEKDSDLVVTDNSPTTLESLPILSSSDDLEFYQSVDFLVWMEKNSG